MDNSIFDNIGDELNTSKEKKNPVIYHKIIEEHKEKEITSDMQERLNKPLEKEVKPKYRDYLKFILDLIERKEIDLYRPDTFINKDIYNDLRPEIKSKADITLVNITNMVRQLNYLYEKGEENSFQLENLVDNIWYTKERIEQVHGDVYKV